LGRTVAELENSLGSGELTEWYSYYRLEPFGQWRDNYHAAILAEAIYNSSGRIKKPAKLHDFMIEPKQVKEQRKTKEMISFMRNVAKQNGKK